LVGLDPAPEPYQLVCLYEGLESGLVATVPAGARRCTVATLRDGGRVVRHGRAVTGFERVEVTCR
jgi:hypothetical protein